MLSKLTQRSTGIKPHGCTSAGIIDWVLSRTRLNRQGVKNAPIDYLPNDDRKEMRDQVFKSSWRNIKTQKYRHQFFQFLDRLKLDIALKFARRMGSCKILAITYSTKPVDILNPLFNFI